MAIPSTDELGPSRTCACGSGFEPWNLFDARGIYAGRVCDACESAKVSSFRAEVFTNPAYEHDEPIEPEDDWT